MRRGGERFSLGKPAPSRPRGRPRSTRVARGSAGARPLAGGGRPGSGGARVHVRRPALHPLDRGRAGDRAARRCARDRRDHRAGDGLAGGRRRANRGARGAPASDLVADRRARHEQAAPARAARRGRRAAAAVLGGGRRGRRAGDLRTGGRQGARPAGTEGPHLRRVARRARGRRSRSPAARPATAWRSSRSSSTGPR